MTLCPKAATSWAELGARCCNHTAPKTTSHFFTPGPPSGVGLLWEVKHADIMGRRETPSWHPVGLREGSQSFWDTSEGRRELLKVVKQGLSLFQGEGKSAGNMNFSPGTGDYDGRVCLVPHPLQSFRDVSRVTAGDSAPFRAKTTRPFTIIFQMTENCAFFSKTAVVTFNRVHL